MTDPIRSALERLLSAVLDGLGQDDHPMGWARVDDAIDAARAALAQPEPEVVEPTDEEIMGLMSQQMHEDLAAAVRAMAAQEGIDSTPAKGVMRIMLNRHVVDLARAVLARWGRPDYLLELEFGPQEPPQEPMHTE